MTIVVCLWAGPGTGKSTNASGVFYKLKLANIETELVHEYAKDLTWEERHMALSNQPYIMGKQQYHVERVMGKVDVIITDSPLPLGCIYRGPAYTEALGLHIMETFRRWNTLNIFLRRDTEHHPYVEAGRNQSLQEAEAVDRQIASFLQEQQIAFWDVRIQPGEETANDIVDLIHSELVVRDEIALQNEEEARVRCDFEG